MLTLSDQDIKPIVALALKEDISSGDLTAELIPSAVVGDAQVISREAAIICGRPWFDETFAQVNAEVQIEWLVTEGQWVTPNTVLCKLTGPARSLLTGERTALNFLQTLSGTATRVREAVSAMAKSTTRLLDTRKTIPGLRVAQKYAVGVGGGSNHRIGLFDAYLIKENHIMACGSIARAIRAAQNANPDAKVEVEVETLHELQEAIDAAADVIMLDNFSLPAIRDAVALCNKRAKLEVSGNVGDDQLPELAATGVDYISMGSLTKNICAIDLSMRITQRHVQLTDDAKNL